MGWLHWRSPVLLGGTGLEGGRQLGAGHALLSHGVGVQLPVELDAPSPGHSARVRAGDGADLTLLARVVDGVEQDPVADLEAGIGSVHDVSRWFVVVALAGAGHPGPRAQAGMPLWYSR